MDNILEVRDLCKQYEQFALQNVSFTIPKGTIMGLIGENGAGKTTIIKALLNQIHYKGEVSILGKDMLRYDKELKQEIGVAFDEVYFDDGLNVKAVSKILSKAYKNFDQEVYDALIKRFKLPIEKNIKGFSKGMKMKLSLVAALSHNPKLARVAPNDVYLRNFDTIRKWKQVNRFLAFLRYEGTYQRF